MRLLLLGTAMLLCACGGAFLAWLTSHKRSVTRESYHAQLAEMLVKQSRMDIDLRRRMPTKND